MKQTRLLGNRSTRTSDLYREPFLPSELERQIFRLAALRYPKKIPVLLRVCHRVRFWVEPLLYKVLRMDKYSVLSAVEAALHYRETPLDFFRGVVEHIMFTMKLESEGWEMGAIPQLLRVNSSLISIAIGQYDSHSAPKLHEILGDMRIRQMTLYLEWSAGLELNLRHPMFQSITHLAIRQDNIFVESEGWQQWSPLASLPELTHLCLPENVSRAIISDALAECPRLLVVVTAFWTDGQIWEAQEFARTIAVSDPRVVVMAVEDFHSDWETGARGGDDFWTRADDLVARKRAGEIQESLYLLQ
ncbi:hypothetical protein C8R43DRAFT_125409 [Mycena crocata]|nr:hypothetical protein C8R43DRAFT_125409 [Mycena crocata]